MKTGTQFLAKMFDLKGFKTCKTPSLLNASQTKSLTVLVTSSSSTLKLEILTLDEITVSYGKKNTGHKVKCAVKEGCCKA